MIPKKGLAGAHDIRAFIDSHRGQLKLKSGFLYKSWDSHDPRLSFPDMDCTWFPCITGDSKNTVASWRFNIPFDYGKEGDGPRPAGYSYFADDKYNFGSYYEYDDPHQPGMKRRVRLAIFGNEMDLEAVANAQGFAESAGVPPKPAAWQLYTMMQFWPYVHWVVSPCSQRDYLTKGYYEDGMILVRDSSTRGVWGPYFTYFIGELWDAWKHVKDGGALMGRINPWHRIVHFGFNLYPKGFHSIPESMKEMCEVQWYIDKMHDIIENVGGGLESDLRKQLWVLETNSRPGQTGPDNPQPDKWPEDKIDWPGVQRFKRWLADMDANPSIQVYCGFIDTHPVYDHYAFFVNDEITAGGRTYAEAGQ